MFKFIIVTIFISSFFLLQTNGNQLIKKKDKKDSTGVAKKVIKKKKSFDDSLKTYKKFPGLFNFYQDTVNGMLLMVVKKEQIDKEFIYFSYSENAPLAAGSFKGNFRENKIFKINKSFNKIEFVKINTSYFFNPSSPLSKASDANISNSLLLTQKIIDTDAERGEYLINADDIFLSESMHRIKPAAPRGVPADQFYSLGSFSKSKSKILKIRNYPGNSDLILEYVFENPYPTFGGGAEIADDRNVSIILQHTLIEMPQNSYSPRYDDPRIGYFLTQQNDMTSSSPTPYKDLIHRWHLEKKDTNAAISEPIEPIIWWIEKTTPVELRETIKSAALSWNLAFEKAGFKNALVVYQQPDTATWEAGDVRYNVLRWTSSPKPPFGGYGPSFVNPRTGQILGADVMLEYAFIRNQLHLDDFYNHSENTTLNATNHDLEYCTLSNELHYSVLFGATALQTYDTLKLDNYMKQAVYYLVLHELGHTLGLNHNMRASHLYNVKDIQNKSLTSVTGLTASVMDYPCVNISPDKKIQGDFFTSKPGPYDMWAIEYGYREFLDSASEINGLGKILNRSTERELAFANDADDMRSPGLHIDPRVMIFDLSSDPILYMTNRLKLIRNLSKDLLEKYAHQNRSYQEFRNAFLIILKEQSSATAVISRYVGGVYVDRSFYGQKTQVKPYAPVSYQDQKRAFKAISENIFAPGALSFQNKLYNYLQAQRRGFDQHGQNEDPKIHDWILNIQKGVFDHWLHPNVLKRLTDSELYGNKYPVSEFMNDLTASIFIEDISTSVNSFRQNLQIEYCIRLINAVKSEHSGFDHISRSALTFQLKNIKKLLKAQPGINLATKSHREYLLFLIEKALSVK